MLHNLFSVSIRKKLALKSGKNLIKKPARLEVTYKDHNDHKFCAIKETRGILVIGTYSASSCQHSDLKVVVGFNNRTVKYVKSRCSTGQENR